MLRYYEEQLLLCPVRQDNGYREYNSLDLKIAHIIRSLSEYGLKIKDIRAIIKSENLSALKTVIQDKIEECKSNVIQSEELMDSLRSILSNLEAQTFSSLEAIPKLCELDENQKDLSKVLVKRQALIKGKIRYIEKIDEALKIQGIEIKEGLFLGYGKWLSEIGAKKGIILTGNTFFVPCLLNPYERASSEDIKNILNCFLGAWNQYQTPMQLSPRYTVPNIQHLSGLYSLNEIISLFTLSYSNQICHLVIPFRELHSLAFRGDPWPDLFEEYEEAVNKEYFAGLPQEIKAQWMLDIDQLEKIHFGQS